MTAGFEVFDANGAQVISVTDRICRVLGTLDVSANGSTANAGLLNGTPWWAVKQISASTTDANYPEITVSGSTLSWVYPSWGARVPVTILYGVF